MTYKTVIVVLSDDFRINDNSALYYASQNYNNIIPLYVYEENYLGRNLGAASKIFLHQALNSFDNLLYNTYDINLLIQKGDPVEVIKKLSKELNIDAIYFNKSYTWRQVQNEQTIKKEFEYLDVQFFKSKLLFHPWEIKSPFSQEYYKVFTPFSKECLKNIDLIELSSSMPEKINSIHNIESLKIEDLELVPKNQGKWHDSILSNWSFSYQEIENNFDIFIKNNIAEYKENRNIPSRNCNSNISPYLRFGMISPKMCFNIIKSSNVDINNQFTLELLWREFAYHVMFYNQDIATKELKHVYQNFKWDDSSEMLQKWQNGKTGFNIVDAGMKELWNTGVMHGRVRMIVASFLIKDLLINWRYGEQWFWDTLVDADPAINPFSWQWIFGSGFDSAPYFRIFNPDLQNKRFDPNDLYCNKWLNNSDQNIRIIDHNIQKNIALDRYKKTLA